MPANTAKGFPYPLGTDRVMDGDDAIHNLATAVDVKAGVSATGRTTIPIVAANAVVSVAVTFPAGRFVNAPAVIASAVTTNPANAYAAAGGTPTAGGFTLYGVRTSGTTALDAYWVATDAA